MLQPGKVANPVRGQLNKENYISLSPYATENLVSRDGFGLPVPRQPTHSPCCTQAESDAYSRDSSRFPRRRPFNYTTMYAMVSPEFTSSRNCVKMAFTAEDPPAQGQ